MNREYSSKHNYFLFALPASVFIAANIFLYQPALLYKGNSLYLNYHFVAYLVWLLPAVVSFSAMLAAPSLIKKAIWQRSFVCVLISLALMMWTATFLKGSEGVLDGRSFKIFTDLTPLIVNALVLIAVGILGFIIALKRLKLINTFLIILNGMLLLLTVSAIFSAPKSLKKRTPFGINNLVEFSSTKNVLVILLDTFQSDLFQALLSENPDWKNQFTGFTYYKEAASVSPTTYLAIPTIHTGEIYTEGHSVLTFYREVESKKSFVLMHQKNGYQATIINPCIYCPDGIMAATEDEVYDPKKAILNEASNLIGISLFRSMPHLVKPLIFQDGKWLLERKVVNNLPKARLSNELLITLASQMKAHATQPTIKFIHSYATHPPAELDRQGEVRETPWSRSSALDQDYYAVTNVIKVLSALKKNHIYDQTAILIMADHGARLAPNNGTSLSYSGTPLFMFKPFNTDGQLHTSEKLISLMDIPKTICAVTGDCGNVNYNGRNILVDWKETRSLKFNYHEGVDNSDQVGNQLLINEYIVQGPPRLATSWKKIISNLPPIKSDLLLNEEHFYRYSGMGWEACEGGNNRWITGSFAELYLPLAKQKAHTLGLQITTFHADQEMTVTANEVNVGKFTVTPGVINHIFVKIPSTIPLQEPIHIVFHFKRWGQPVNSDADQRALAVLFREKIALSSH